MTTVPGIQSVSPNLLTGNQAPADKCATVGKEIPGTDPQAHPQSNPTPILERFVRLLDPGLIASGQMTPVNFASRTYRAFEEVLTTTLHNHSSIINRAAAIITGAIISARISGTNPCSLQNAAITGLHQAPGVVSATCGETSGHVPMARKLVVAGNIAATLCSLYSPIISGNLPYATMVLTGLAARYGAHSLIHYHLQQLCNRLPRQCQEFLEPWLQTFGQIAVTAALSGNEQAKREDRQPSINTETGDHLPRHQNTPGNRTVNRHTEIPEARLPPGNKTSVSLNPEKPSEQGPRYDQSATANRWGLPLLPMAKATEIHHYLWQNVSDFMAGHTERTAFNNDHYRTSENFSVWTFPDSIKTGWMFPGSPAAQTVTAECLRYQSCAPDIRQLSNTPLTILTRESGDYCPTLNLVQYVHTFNSTSNHTASSRHLSCKEPIKSTYLDASTIAVTPTSLMVAISSCEPQNNSTVYLFTYDTDTNIIRVNIGEAGFITDGHRDPMEELTDRIRGAATINTPWNDSNGPGQDSRNSPRQKRQNQGSSATNTLTTVRFAPDSSSAASGAVQVLQNGTWSYLDPAGFNDTAAAEICEQMGFPKLNARVINSNPHNHDAVVVRCQPLSFGDRQLISSKTRIYVKPLFYTESEWFPFDPDTLTSNETSVMCHELGFSRDYAAAAPTDLLTDCSWYDYRVEGDIQCSGNEESVLDCFSTAPRIRPEPNNTKCARIACIIQQEFRLVECQPEVPVKYRTIGMPMMRLYRESEWQVIHSSRSFPQDLVGAGTLCSYLGYPQDGAELLPPPQACRQYLEKNKYMYFYFKCHSKNTWLCEIRDYPVSPILPPAPYKFTNAINCPSRMQVSNECGEASDNPLLVMWHLDRWHFMEGKGFDNNAASAVCREMGHSGKDARAEPQPLSLPVFDFLGWPQINCSGNETHFLDCELIGPQIHSGMNISGVTIFCENRRLNSTITGANCQRITTPVPSTIQPTTRVPTGTTNPGSIPDHGNRHQTTDAPRKTHNTVFRGTLAAASAGAVLIGIPCCLNGRKLKQHDPDLSPRQLMANTIRTTLRSPLYFRNPHSTLIESTEDLATADDDEHASWMDTAV